MGVLDVVSKGSSVDIKDLDYKQPEKIRRMKYRSKIPGSNQIRKMHMQGRGMAVPH